MAVWGAGIGFRLGLFSDLQLAPHSWRPGKEILHSVGPESDQKNGNQP